MRDLPDAPFQPKALVGDGFEGAERRTSDMVLWDPSRRSADADILPSKPRGDARARDLYRNDAYVAAGAALHKDSIVGSAYLLNARPVRSVLQRQDRRFDETWETEFQEEVETLFGLSAESPRAHLDAKGTKTLTDMVRLAVGLDLLTGEVLATVEWLREAGRPFNTAIQMIEIARLSTPERMTDNRYLRGGVDRDANGKPKGYYIRVAHPYDVYSFEPLISPINSWRYVEARKPWGRPQVIHLFEEHEPGQSRGVNALMAALRELHIMRTFRPVQLQNAIVQATYAATIESELPTSVAYESLGAKPSDNDPLNAWVATYLSALEEYSAGSASLKIDGVKIPHLLPGSKLKMQPAGANGQGVGEEFEKSLIRYLAADLGVSYEELSKDWSETNYSSARAGINATYRHMQSRKKRCADRFATQIYDVWLEEQINKGGLTTVPRGAADLYYTGLNREAFSACDWIGASRGQIDEMKETQAAVLRLKWNLSTYEDELARLGKDWRKVIAQRQRENQVLVQSDLPRPDVDPAADTNPPTEGVANENP